MRKLTLVMAVLLIGSATPTVAVAQGGKRGKDFNDSRYRNAQPIVFVERGVEFMVFPDGSFDFNTDKTYFGRRHLRNRNVSWNTYGSSRYWNGNQAMRSRGVYINYDRFGQVRRINNIFIDYNRRGKVKRIGSVFMDYKRGNGRLKQVGGLRVNYNHWGEIVHIRGVVNPFNRDMNCGNFDDYAWNDHYYDDYDDDYDDWNHRKGKRKRGK